MIIEERANTSPQGSAPCEECGRHPRRMLHLTVGPVGMHDYVELCGGCARSVGRYLIMHADQLKPKRKRKSIGELLESKWAALIIKITGYPKWGGG